MGMFSSIAKSLEIDDIIKWVEEHKTLDLDRGFEIVFYEDLIAFLKAEKEAADWD